MIAYLCTILVQIVLICGHHTAIVVQKTIEKREAIGSLSSKELDRMR